MFLGETSDVFLRNARRFAANSNIKTGIKNDEKIFNLLRLIKMNPGKAAIFS